ncbi:hypothetical protein P8452_66209 [Trifolium repens]|nr:hypothetical protein P8452_66209 [Trifolium repens]
MNPSLPFVDDDAAGRRHHATSCLSRKTRASPIKIVQRSSKSDLIMQINDVDHRESWLIPCRESGNKSKSPLGETEVKFQLTRDTYT